VSSNRATPNHRLLFGRGRVRHGALAGIGTLAEMWDSHRPIYMVFTIEYLCQIPSITIDLWDLPYQNGISMVIFVGFYHQSVEDQWINHPTDKKLVNVTVISSATYQLDNPTNWGRTRPWLPQARSLG
jgi:hypothetical protein